MATRIKSQVTGSGKTPEKNFPEFSVGTMNLTQRSITGVILGVVVPKKNGYLPKKNFGSP